MAASSTEPPLNQALLGGRLNRDDSASLEEADRQPLRLCPVCLKKLQWNRGFDVLKRYDRLLAFFKEHGLQPEAEWTAARLQRIRTK